MERSDRQLAENSTLRDQLSAAIERDTRCQSALVLLRDELAETRNELQAALGRIELLEGK